MNVALVILALATTAPAAINLEAGTQLTFQGNFVAEKGSPVVTEKKFTLSVLISEVGDQTATLYWTLQEQGRGGWSWINRYLGHWTLAASGRGRLARPP